MAQLEQSSADALEPVAESSGSHGKLTGTTIAGRYQVEALLGEGGMGEVYRVEHILMRKRMALKVLRTEMSSVPEVVARFEREAMAAGHIDHPNVAAATDFGQLEDGSFFLVLEFIEGANLRSIIDAGPIPIARALEIVRQIASALVRAHGLGIVHRDLKPENVMLVKRDDHPDFVKVLDFGIAKVSLEGLTTSPSGEHIMGKALTRVGTVFGTPEYMAPEQALGGDVDGRADIYSLGIMFYEMVTGDIPFKGDDVVVVLGQQITAPVPPFSVSAPTLRIPSSVEAIALKMLEKKAADRFEDARVLIEALEAVAAEAAHVPVAVGHRRSWTARDSLAKTGFDLTPGEGLPSHVSMHEGEQSGRAKLITLVRRTVARVTSTGFFAADRYMAATRGVQHRFPKLRKIPTLVLALGAGGLAVTVLGTVIFVLVHGGHSASPNAALVSDAGGAVEVPSAVAPMLQLLSSDTIEKAAAQGVPALEALERQHPDDPRVVHALIKSYMDQKTPALAMRRVAKLLQLEPKASDDADVLQSVSQAVQSSDAIDDALALLEGPLGEIGADTLYDISLKTLPPLSRTKVNQALARSDVRGHASIPLLITLDLRASTTCESKHGLLARAQKQGDRRSLTYLRPLTVSRGCGVLNLGDCWSCLRKDNALHDAITAVEGRSK